MFDVIQCMEQAVLVSTTVRDIKVTDPNEGGLKPGENTAPKNVCKVV